MLKLGSTSISELYVGGTKIKEVYLGSLLVYTSTPSTPQPTITWSVQSGSWTEGTNTSAYDGKLFTSVSPGSSGSTVVRCTFSGVKSVTFNCVYNGENNYDYLTVGALDTACTRTSYGTSLKGTSGTAKDITFGCDTGEHYVEFCYSKDGSVDTSPDCAVVYLKSVSAEGVEIATNVYIATSDGKLVNYHNWTSSSGTAVGVAVVTDNSSFIIGRTSQQKTALAWSSNTSTDLSDVPTSTSSTTIATYYDGVSYTDAMIAAGSEYNTTSYAAGYARSCSITYGDSTLTGYLGSAGEWLDALNNHADVIAAFTRIGETFVPAFYYFWTSCEHSVGYSWLACWVEYNSNWYLAQRSNSLTATDFCVVPFYKIPSGGGESTPDISLVADITGTMQTSHAGNSLIIIPGITLSQDLIFDVDRTIIVHVTCAGDSYSITLSGLSISAGTYYSESSKTIFASDYGGSSFTSAYTSSVITSVSFVTTVDSIEGIDDLDTSGITLKSSTTKRYYVS